MSNTKPQTIAVDFDNTIRGKGDVIISNVVEMMKASKAQGNSVVIYTARGDDQREYIKSWLTERSVPFDDVVTAKLGFDVLIDDKAIRPDEVSSTGQLPHKTVASPHLINKQWLASTQEAEQ